MTDALERVIRPIVEGQLRSYLNDHPEIAAAYAGKWRPKGEGVVRSVSKRIMADLLCAQTRVRLMEAALVPSADAAPKSERGSVLLRSLRVAVEWLLPPRASPPDKGQTE